MPSRSRGRLGRSRQYIANNPSRRRGPPGAVLAIGTEENLVRRLAAMHPEKIIFPLSEASRTPARCLQMAQIDLPHLLWSLESIIEGKPVNVVRVDAETAELAKIALQRMIDIKAVTSLTETG